MNVLFRFFFVLCFSVSIVNCIFASFYFLVFLLGGIIYLLEPWQNTNIIGYSGGCNMT